MQRGASRAGLLVVNVGALAQQQIRTIKAVEVDGVHERRAPQGVQTINRNGIVLENLGDSFAVASAGRTM
jgi:hypothetical protein